MKRLYIAKIGFDTPIPDQWVIVDAKLRRGWRGTPYWEVTYSESV